MNEEHKIVQHVYEAKEDIQAADRLIGTYMPFIKMETAKITRRNGSVLRGQRQTERGPGGAVQDCADPAYLWHPLPAPDAGRGKHEPGIPVVHWVSAERSGAALLHGKL